MSTKDTVEQLKDLVVNSLEDLKGIDIKVLHVSDMTSLTDYMIICSGTSERHVKALSNNVAVEVKKAKFNIRSEGEKDGEWVLLDLGDVIVHTMLPKTREFYDLEGLWQNSDAA